MSVLPTADRPATTKGWGAIRDGIINATATAVGAAATGFILQYVPSPDLASWGGQLSHDIVSSNAYLLVGAFTGLATLGRKWASDKLAKSSQ